MAKRPPGYWKQYYQEHREQLLQTCAAYQGKNRDKRRVYSKEYYQRNPEKWIRTPEQIEARRIARRARYASDPKYRAAAIAATKLGRIRHPTGRSTVLCENSALRSQPMKKRSRAKAENVPCAGHEGQEIEGGTDSTLTIVTKVEGTGGCSAQIVTLD